MARPRERRTNKSHRCALAVHLDQSTARSIQLELLCRAGTQVAHGWQFLQAGLPASYADLRLSNADQTRFLEDFAPIITLERPSGELQWPGSLLKSTLLSLCDVVGIKQRRFTVRVFHCASGEDEASELQHTVADQAGSSDRCVARQPVCLTCCRRQPGWLVEFDGQTIN